MSTRLVIPFLIAAASVGIGSLVLPTQPRDHSLRHAEHFTSSEQCAVCHTPAPAATAMRSEIGDDISPYGLWQGTMMANAFRDPYFRAQLRKETVASGEAVQELCLRCHSPNAWLNGRASGEGADGSQLNTMDLQGLTCTTCHRLVPPEPIAGESPRDATERAHIVETVGSVMRGSGAGQRQRRLYRRFRRQRSGVRVTP